MSFDRPEDPNLPASPWVQHYASLVPNGGTVLDLACGHGRHVRYFRAKGHPVVAVDIDATALRDLAADPGTEIMEHDLENASWPFDDREFAGVVVTNYLYRPLLPAIVASVARGGVLIYETFGQGNEKIGRPRNPDFLLAPGELYDAVAPGLQVVAYEQGLEETPRKAVRQRIAAVNGSDPAPLP